MAKSFKSSAKSQKSRKSSKRSAPRAPRVMPLTRKNLKRHNASQASSVGSILTALDARVLRHVPPPMSLGPYTVVRSRVQRNVFTNASGQFTTYLFGAHSDNSLGTSNCITPLIGIGGVGTQIPGNATDDLVQDSILAPYVGTLASSTASCALHSLTVVVNCLDAALTASGQVFMGSLSNRVARSNYGTWNALGLDLFGRRELKPRSAYSTMADPFSIVTAPLDVTDWCLHRPLVSVSTTVANNVTIDTLSPIVVLFPPTTASVEYSVSIFCEWRMNFHQPLLASTHQTHTPSAQSLWSDATRLVSTLGGDIASAASSVVGSVGPVLEAAHTVGSVAEGLGHLAGIRRRW